MARNVHSRTDAARLGSEPQHERADLPALADREGVLGDLERVICDAWGAFDVPRPSDEPQLAEELAARLAAPLPEDAGDAEVALDDAAHAPPWRIRSPSSLPPSNPARRS